jgi:hypothetical protein
MPVQKASGARRAGARGARAAYLQAPLQAPPTRTRSNAMAQDARITITYCNS